MKIDCCASNSVVLQFNGINPNQYILQRINYLSHVKFLRNSCLIIMPKNCAAVNCTSGYKSNPTKHNFYNFPNRNKSPERRKKWIRAVKRGSNYEPSQLILVYLF